MQYTIKTFKVSLEVCEPGEKLGSSEDVARFARAIYKDLDADKEHFVLLAVNIKNRVIGFKVVSTGSMTSSIVHPREVFRSALALDAARIICVHNHPAGEPTPSPEDNLITKLLKEGGELLKIALLDHVILGTDRHWSYADHKML